MRSTLRHAPAAAGIVLLLGLAACTSPDAEPGAGDQAGAATEVPAEDATEDAATEETAETDAAEEPTVEEEPAVGSAAGTVSVDGVEYEITELRNCEPLQDGAVDRELELQGFGEHEGERTQVDVYVQELAGTPYDDVSWSGPEGVYGGPQDAVVELDATSVRGTATLMDSLTQTETVSIEFELEVPAETIACR
ncbi:hypothetical protein LQF12_03835 [Ruania suaedae]|uniref:hypothetical protein n=1 Tax=Ruania suaedae TaxID=2897774 RepID=UPI001E6315CF|nr:hypothetical protein [Ruania suaedae]UFU03750.1 hypothetical protein LQF12_03835 [Ruania suaedae]